MTGQIEHPTATTRPEDSLAPHLIRVSHDVNVGNHVVEQETRIDPDFAVNRLCVKYPCQEGNLAVYLQALANVGEYDNITLRVVTDVRPDGTHESGIDPELAILIGEKPFNSSPDETLPNLTLDYIRSRLANIDIRQGLHLDNDPDGKDRIRVMWAEQLQLIKEIMQKTQAAQLDLKAEYKYSPDQQTYLELHDQLTGAAVADLKAKLLEAAQSISGISAV